jgi:pimeloyl-ACP methyl ester carboxylesterase
MRLLKSTILCLSMVTALGFVSSAARFNPALAVQSTAEATSAATASPEATVAARPSQPIELKFVGADDLALPALEYQAPKLPAPAILLLHEVGGNKGEWFPWAGKWAALGLNVFAIDIRGYGQVASSKTDPVKTDQDLQRVLQQINERPEVIPHQIGVLGGSMGAAYALIACAKSKECRTVVLLSVPPDKGDLQDPIETLGNRPILQAVSSLDSPFYETSQDYDKRAKGDHQLLVYEGSAHATLILYRHPELVDTIGQWFVKYLVNAPTAAATTTATAAATAAQ